MQDIRDRELEIMSRCLPNGTKVQLCKRNKFRDLMYIMMTIVNTIWNIGNLLKEGILGVFITTKNGT